MNRHLTSVVAASLLFLNVLPATAAEKTVTVQATTRIIDGRREWRESRSYSYAFAVEVLSEREGRKQEGGRWGRPFVTAYPNEEYRVRIHNPLPVPVAANLSIDGLNSITGEPGSPAGGSKWIIEPFSFVDISGWQVSGREARRFIFTSRESSYASWRSNAWGRDLSVNVGVIGVAYFWSQGALDDYFDDNPIVISRRRDEPEDGGWGGFEPQLQREKQAAPSGREQQRAGTGMGRRQSNPVREVRFPYDRGMYEVQDALIIYYDFPERGLEPQPFEKGRYAPEGPGDGERGWRPYRPRYR